MNDKELLELAAKAAGFPPEWNGNIRIETDNNPRQWNPLKDDGDCARLEAALSLNVTWHNNFVKVESLIAEHVSHYEDFNGDKQAARRRASVRAAAVITAAQSDPTSLLSTLR